MIEKSSDKSSDVASLEEEREEDKEKEEEIHSFILSREEEGQKLLDQYDAQAVWVGIDGTISYSPGFKDLIRT